MAQDHPVGWFEIPVTDMQRAITFYESVFSMELARHELGPLDMAWFPMVENGSGATGALVEHDAYTPSQDGVLIYFTAPDGDVDAGLAKVEAAGGEVVIPKKPIGEHGFIGVFIDSEGNRIAMHATE